MLKNQGKNMLCIFHEKKNPKTTTTKKTSNICFLFEKDLASSFLMAY